VAAALDEARRRTSPEAVQPTLGLIWAQRHLHRQSDLQLGLADQADHRLALRREWWA
jgi:hypothetical protein